MTEEDFQRISEMLDAKLEAQNSRLEAVVDVKLRPIQYDLRVIGALVRGLRDSVVNINARLEFIEEYLGIAFPDKPRH